MKWSSPTTVLWIIFLNVAWKCNLMSVVTTGVAPDGATSLALMIYYSQSPSLHTVLRQTCNLSIFDWACSAHPIAYSFVQLSVVKTNCGLELYVIQFWFSPLLIPQKSIIWSQLWNYEPHELHFPIGQDLMFVAIKWLSGFLRSKFGSFMQSSNENLEVAHKSRHLSGPSL